MAVEGADDQPLLAILVGLGTLQHLEVLRDEPLQVESAEELAREVIGLLTDEVRRRSLGERAKSLVDRNRGALRNTIDGLAGLVA